MSTSVRSPRPKILLHDYSGHPFQYELSEELAKRGYPTVHVYCGSIPTTPQSVDVGRKVEGAPRVVSLTLAKPVTKQKFLQRFLLERAYGRRLQRLILRERPGIVVLSNTPVDTLGPALAASAKVGAASVIWVQDLYGEAALRILPRKLGILGKGVGHLYQVRERKILARAGHLVAITEAFEETFRCAGIHPSRWTVIPNWAPLHKIDVKDRDNDWSRAHGFTGKMTFLYSGTLGFKHNPELFLQLGEALRARPDGMVVINSEGEVAAWLRRQVEARGLSDLIQINGFQPFDQMAEVLASGDVLVTILEPAPATG